MRGLFIVAGLAAVMLWAGYSMWRDPRVQDILKAPIAAGRHSPIPGAVKVSSRTLEKKPAESKPASVKRVHPAAPARHEDIGQLNGQLPANVTPNETLSRVVLQILAAKKLAPGISISVFDRSLIVAGTVDSEEKKKAIIEILEKARETRIIDAGNLLVIPEAPDPAGKRQ